MTQLLELARSKNVVSGNVLRVVEVTLPDEVLIEVIKSIDPTAVSIESGIVKVVGPADKRISEWEWKDIAQYQENPLLHVILYLNTPVNDREKVFVLLPQTGILDLQQSAQQLKKASVAASVWAVSQFLHGSCDRIQKDLKLAPKLVSNHMQSMGVTLSAEDFTEYEPLWKMRAPGVVNLIFAAFSKMNQAFRNRAIAGIAGHRILQIIGMYVQWGFDFSAEHPVIQFLATPEVQANKPFITLHPSSSKNPLQNCAKLIMAHLGAMARKNHKTMQQLKEASGELFAKYVIDSMSVDIAAVGGSMGNLASFKEALSDKYSLVTRK